jgi:hypothetical protein
MFKGCETPISVKTEILSLVARKLQTRRNSSPFRFPLLKATFSAVN